MERTALYRATTSDPEPASEFEITACIQLTYDTLRQNDIVLFLRRRLHKENPHIKLKTLKLLKHLSERGRSDFRKVVQLDLADYIRSLQTYRGPPDPTRGDVLNQEIREAALQALTSFFATENNSAQSEYVAPQKFRFTTPEEDHHEAEIMDRLPPPMAIDLGGHTPPKKMIGFGNMPPQSESHRNEESAALQGFKMILGSIGQKLPNTWANSLGISKHGLRSTTVVPSTYSDNPNRHTFNSSASSPFSAGGVSSPVQCTRRSVSRPYAEHQVAGKYDGLISSEPGNRKHMPYTTSHYLGVYEDRLVEKLIQPAGARVAPQQKLLDEFVTQCQTLDLDTVLLIVLTKMQLESATWQQNVRCLYLLKALLSAGTAHTVASKTRQFFMDHPKQVDVILSFKESGYCAPIVAEVVFLIKRGGASDDEEVMTPEEVLFDSKRICSPNKGDVSLLDLDDNDDKPLKVVHDKKDRFPLQALLRKEGCNTTKSLLDLPADDEETFAI